MPIACAYRLGNLFLSYSHSAPWKTKKHHIVNREPAKGLSQRFSHCVLRINTPQALTVYSTAPISRKNRTIWRTGGWRASWVSCPCLPRPMKCSRFPRCPGQGLTTRYVRTFFPERCHKKKLKKKLFSGHAPLPFVSGRH